MRISILNKTAGGISEGYRKYLENIIFRMASHPEISALLVGMPDTIDISEWQKKFPSVYWLSMKSNLLSFFGLDREAKKKVTTFSPSVVFIPTSRFLRINAIPTVTMVRNMEPLIWKDKNPLFEKIINRLRERATYNSSVKANRIIAVSHFVKECIEKKWKIDANKIGVVYHGIKLTQKQNGHCPNSIPASWKGEFLFIAGSIRPSRGLEDVIYALRYFSEKSRIRGLAIAGEISLYMKGYQKKLKLLIQAHNLSSRVCWTGQLDDAEMTWCYRNCKIFIMTSRVEACPNIALEAMANRCIIVSTKNPPMPELFGDSAVYYPEKDGKALAEEIHKILNWDNRTLIERSKHSENRAIKFSWHDCAEKTIAELKKAVEISDV